jgi:hypothetical protein
MIRRLAAAVALVAAAGCNLPSESPDPYVDKLKANPTDTNSIANLAILGRSSVAPLLAALEEQPALRAAAMTALAVGGEPCWPAMVDYLDQGARDEIKLDLLEIAASHRWKGALRKLAGRIDHPSLGPWVYEAIARIVGTDSTPPENPWVGGQLDSVKRAEFDRWVGKNVRTLVDLDLRASLYSRTDLDKVQKLVENEFTRW